VLDELAVRDALNERWAIMRDRRNKRIIHHEAAGTAASTRVSLQRRLSAAAFRALEAPVVSVCPRLLTRKSAAWSQSLDCD